MKKFKYLLIAFVAAVLCSCAMSVEDVAKEVREDIEAQWEKELGEDVSVSEIILVHEGGNNYSSIVDISVGIETARYSLKVVYDGDAYTWELFE